MGDIWNIKEYYKESMGNKVRASLSHGNRGIFAGGSPYSNIIEAVTISSLGNAFDWGDLSQARYGAGAGASNARGLFQGGNYPGGNLSNTADYIEFATIGDAVDFGNLTAARKETCGLSNQVRGIAAGGATPGRSDVIDYVTITSTGDHTDFGDLTVGRSSLAATASPTRGLVAGGYAASGPYKNTIDFITIASAGNAIDFGDLTLARSDLGASGSNIRGIFGGGSTGSLEDEIDYVTIASAGDAIDFGDLTGGRQGMGGSSCSNNVRGLFGGGGTPSDVNTIDYITIATAGNAADFGDLTAVRSVTAQTSNGHGGLEALEARGLPLGSGRLILGGGGPTALNVLEVINISTLGNASDFGDLAKTSQMMAACGSHTRGVWQGGLDPSALNDVGAVEIHSLGNAFDFGNLTAARGNMQQGASNRTRAMAAGGTTPSYVDTVDYITIATAGDSSDFGNLSIARKATGGAANSTRGIFGGGYTPAGGSTAANYRDEIDYFTIASTGDSTDFGNLITNRQQGGTCASSTRAIVSFGGETAGRPFNYANSHTAEIDYVTTASTGDASDFGDLSAVRSQNAGNSSETRGISCAGLQLAPGGGDMNIMEYITIASTGNTTDFGDASAGKRSPGAVSDAHGGLS